MEEPRQVESYILFDANGLDLWVHREIIEEMDHPSRLRFNFGKMGWCRVDLGLEGEKK